MIKFKKIIIVIFVLLSIWAISYGSDIFDAIEKGDLLRIKEMVKEDPNLVNMYDKCKTSPLFTAMQNNNIDAARFLLDNGANINIKNYFGSSLLLQAIRRNSNKMIDLFIDKGIDLNIVSNSGFSALSQSILTRNQKLFDLLILKGVNVKIRGTKGESFLHFAIMSNWKEIIEVLINKGVSVNSVKSGNMTPLHYAAILGRKEIAEMLIKNGANLNIKSSDFGTPFHFASAAGQDHICKLLKSAGAEIGPRKFLKIKGDYLGEKNPGIPAKAFVPEIFVEIYRPHSAPAFSPGGKEVYWQAIFSQGNREAKIWFMKQVDGKWQAPEIAPFSKDYFSGGPFFSSDGKRLFFASRRPLKKGGKAKRDSDIWYVDREGANWGEPKNLGPIINKNTRSETFPSVSKNGNLYSGIFGKNERGIYKSSFINGKYSKFEVLGKSINSKFIQTSPAIAPDESYIVFHSDREDCLYSHQLFISFKKKDSSWGRAVNMTKKLGLEKSASPQFSPDGKYLFFTSNKEIYWVSTKIIDYFKNSDID